MIYTTCFLGYYICNQMTLTKQLIHGRLRSRRSTDRSSSVGRDKTFILHPPTHPPTQTPSQKTCLHIFSRYEHPLSMAVSRLPGFWIWRGELHLSASIRTYTRSDRSAESSKSTHPGDQNREEKKKERTPTYLCSLFYEHQPIVQFAGVVP